MSNYLKSCQVSAKVGPKGQFTSRAFDACGCGRSVCCRKNRKSSKCLHLTCARQMHVVWIGLKQHPSLSVYYDCVILQHPFCLTKLFACRLVVVLMGSSSVEENLLEGMAAKPSSWPEYSSFVTRSRLTMALENVVLKINSMTDFGDQLADRSLPIPEVRGSNPVIGKILKWKYFYCWKDKKRKKCLGMAHLKN